MREESWAGDEGARWVDEARANLHMTLGDIARALGVSVPAVSLWRRGERRGPARAEVWARLEAAGPRVRWRQALRAGEEQLTGEALRDLRGRRSKDTCAQIAQVSVSRWRRWEEGREECPLSAQAWVRLLEMDRARLLEMAQEEAP